MAVEIDRFHITVKSHSWEYERFSLKHFRSRSQGTFLAVFRRLRLRAKRLGFGCSDLYGSAPLPPNCHFVGLLVAESPNFLRIAEELRLSRAASAAGTAAGVVCFSPVRRTSEITEWYSSAVCLCPQGLRSANIGHCNHCRPLPRLGSGLSRY